MSGILAMPGPHGTLGHWLNGSSLNVWSVMLFSPDGTGNGLGRYVLQQALFGGFVDSIVYEIPGGGAVTLKLSVLHAGVATAIPQAITLTGAGVLPLAPPAPYLAGDALIMEWGTPSGTITGVQLQINGRHTF